MSGMRKKKVRHFMGLGGRSCIQVLRFCLFTETLLLCVAQNTHMQNVAISKECGMSSVNTDIDSCSAAINGNTNTEYQSDPLNCIHTAESDTSPSWWVDLGEKFNISMITIYERTNHLSRMLCVNVSIDGVVVERFEDQGGWVNANYNITVRRDGQVVKITKDCDSNGPVINICEVQVWVCDDGWYGDCTQSCGYCDSGSVCDKLSGSCGSCKTGFQPPLCQALSSSETVGVAGPVAGTAICCSVVFFVIGTFFGWWLRRLRPHQPPSPLESPYEMPMTCDQGTFMPTPRPDEKPDTASVDNTAFYNNIGHSINVYDALQARGEDDTAAYMSLHLNNGAQ